MSQHKRVTGLDGPSSTANFTASFPQPRDVVEEDEEEAENGEEAEDQEDGGLIERDLSAVREGTLDGEPLVEPSSSAETRPKHKWLQRTRHEFNATKELSSSQSAASFVTAPSQPMSPDQKARRKDRQPSSVGMLNLTIPEAT